MKKVNEVMTRDIHIASPDQTLAEAAAEMAKADIGCLPVGHQDKLVGMITDRDIVIRAVADGDMECTVDDIVTDDVVCVTADMTTAEAAELMSEHQVRRLPVVDEDENLVGIVSLGDLAVKENRESRMGETLENISEGVKRH